VVVGGYLLFIIVTLIVYFLIVHIRIMDEVYDVIVLGTGLKVTFIRRA